MTPNSLFGAMAIGGMALALRLRKKWPELSLNEDFIQVVVARAGPTIPSKGFRDC